MSFDLRNIREVSNEPQAKFINQLAKKISKFLTEQQTEKLENKEDIYSAGQDVDTVVKFHSDLSSTKHFTFDTIYYPPLEPDADTLRVWVRGTNLGNTLRDWSEQGFTINLYGDPLLIDGTPLDLGIHTDGTKSIALKLNRPTSVQENEEYISIGHDPWIRCMEELNTGISFFIRFRIHDLSEQNSWSRTLFQKRDDVIDVPDNGIRVLVDPDGRVIVRIRKGGVQYNSQTATSTIATNTVYDLWVTYAVSGNAVKVYVNNVDKSLTSPALSSNWDTDETDFDWYIFKHANSNNGHVHGDFYDFRVYREKIVSAAEAGYMYTNKWTIANIPYGQVAITNYYATYYEAQQAYTTAGFTTAGYST